ncbi:MAG: CPBP family intramembrane glutamate endopeptidase, partial [Anaerovoracaceae bacterium]
MITSKEYTANLKNYRTADGIKAIILYIIYMAVLFLQGFVYTTNLDANVINVLQIIFPLFLLIIGII